MSTRFRLFAAVLAAAIGCGPRHVSHIQSTAPLGRVVIYRNGVAFYERSAVVDDGRIVVRVPRDRVDDFLKSLTVVDEDGAALPVTIPRQQADDGEYLTMVLETPDRRRAKVLLTYVTESPAWKPSYRIAVGGDGNVMLEGWAVVDNTSGEDWRGVQVGVGASSALSFRYDLWSVRTIDRALLAEKEQFAVAPPTGLSPYGGNGVMVAGDGAAAGAATGLAIDLEEDELRRRPGDVAGASFSGSTTLENQYYVDGINTSSISGGTINGRVTDEGSREPLVGVTVVATAPTMQGTQTAITDEKGAFNLSSLPPGQYSLDFYYADVQVRRTNIKLQPGKTLQLGQRINTRASAGETIAITDTAPTIDPSSTRQGITLSQDYIRNVPVPAREFASALGSAAGSQADEYHGPTQADGDRKIAGLLQQLRGTKSAIVVESHAEIGIPGAESRARDRANVVRNQLIDAGVAPSRIKITYQVAGGEPEKVRLYAAEPAPAEPAAGGAPAIDTDDSPVGESHFITERVMNVGAGTSAMVSVLKQETKGDVVYLYDPLSERGNHRYAFRAIHLLNPTDDTLEPGPVTVYGDKRFIGEGLTDSIPPGAPAVVPFALDKQIIVEPTVDDGDEISRLVTLERGVLTAQIQHKRTTRLAITSRLHHATTLYVRHKVEDGWELIKSPATPTRSGDAHLFAVEVPAGGTREIEFVAATPLERTLQLASPATLSMLEVYVQSPHPTAALKTALADLLATHRSIGDTVERIETLRDQLYEYRQRSDELTAQVVTLKAVKTGGELLRVLKQKMIETSERVQAATIALVDAQEALLIGKTQFANQLAELRLPDAFAGKAAALKP
jgi:hypothetical protein